MSGQNLASADDPNSPMTAGAPTLVAAPPASGSGIASAAALIVAITLVFALWLPAAMNPAGRWSTLLDNTHWTLAYTFAALLVWQSLRASSGDELTARRWLALALSCLAVGQWMWDLQVFTGWNPFPGPSDAAFVLVGLCAMVAFAHLGRHRLTGARYHHALLDVAGFGLAALTLVLVVFLPRGEEIAPWQMAVLTAYPVLLVSASAAAVISQLYLRLRWGWRWMAVLGGLIGQSAVWMMWNIDTLDDQLGNGRALNLAFSVVTLVLGWGAAGWRLQVVSSARFDRICEGIIRQLPLLMIAMTSVSVGLLVLDDEMTSVMRGVLLGLALIGLLSAPLRQAMHLGERDRLLAAEVGLAESRARLEYLAHHDPLTGLANLTLLRERAREAMDAADRGSQSVALLFVDLDQFKEVNDTLGHSVGDALLTHTARQLETIFRRSDTVCRYGGDEFAIILPGVHDLAEVRRVADELMRMADHNAVVNGHELPMHMSVGAALYPADARTFDELMQCADIAMYQAKAAGRHAYRFYDAQMSTEASSRVQMRGRLARALERGELALHYQPIVDLAEHRIVGAEALLRWQHPELGCVAPTAFIPVAESSGLIVSIGTWVLQQACLQAAAWHAAGMSRLTVAVNLSVLQFRRGNLETIVLDALRASGLPARFLELEVTESVLMEERDKVTSTLERLRRQGVRVAIDDFGTGYCNIAYLKQLPASKLKMDQSLIHEIATNSKDAGIARTIIGIAHQLNMVTVAEGVENARQCQLLQECGCDLAQGFLFSEAVTGTRFAELCRDAAIGALRAQSA